jgi:WD40 repeat protein
MKMSPDGSRLLLSSERWDTKLVAIDQTGSQVLASVSGANRRGAGVSACAISNDGKTILLGSRDGDVLRSGPDTEGLVPVSQLVGFNLGGAAIDVSIDGGSRFVALLGESLLGSCLNGMTGHPLRIWDLKGKRPDFPVASTCLSGNVRAIGALEATPQGWVLPIFELRDGKLDRSDYPCIACAIADGQATLAKNLVDVARKFQGTVLPPERIKALYGFSP